jgi:hypothetical protein
VVFLFLLATGAHAAPAPAVVTGQPSPLGLPFSTFASPALMADGRVVFLGSSSGAFRRAGGNLVHVSAAGDVLADGRVVAGVSPPALGPGGCVAVRVFLVNGGSRILERCGATTTVVAVTGESAPGGGSFAEFDDNVATGGAGQVAFTAILGDGNMGLYVWAGGALSDAVRIGEAAPNGGIFSALHLIGVATDGRVGFRGTVAAGRDGIFMATANGFKVMAQTGDLTPVGSTFRTVTGASMNDSGTLVFRGDLTENGKAGVFRVDASGPVPQVQPVVLEGATVGGPTITISSLPSSLTPAINGNGTVAFRASVAGGEGGSGIFVAAPGATLQQIVSARDKTAVGALVRLRDPAIADDGSLVIPASVTGNGPLLVLYRAGTLSTLAQVGQATDVDTGDERFRFAQPSVRGAAEDAVFTGTREGIFVAGRDGSLQMLAFVGGKAPGSLGGTFAGFDPPAADAPGVAAFGVEVKDGKKASRAIVASGPRGLRVAAESSERVRGGRLVDFFASTIDSLSRPDVGPKGELAFEATLQGGKTPRALLLRRSGRPEPVAMAQKKAPGGGKYGTFGTPALLRGGNMAFVTQAGDNNEPRLCLRRGSGTLLLAKQGGGAPGRLPGRFATFDPPTASDALVGFRATLDQGNKEGLYLASPSAAGLLVGTGDAAPAGGSFRGFSTPAMGSRYAVFLGRLIGSTTSPALYRVRADAVPAADAGPAATDVLALPGAPTPLGGTIQDFEAYAANRVDAAAVVTDLVGASARTALFVLDSGDTIVP